MIRGDRDKQEVEVMCPLIVAAGKSIAQYWKEKDILTLWVLEIKF